MNHAMNAKPRSAMPSSVFRPGLSYSSIWTPRERRSATSAARSLTRHAAWVWEVCGADGALGDVKLRIAAALEADGFRALREDLQPDFVGVEVPRGVQVWRQQDEVDRMVTEHGYPLSLTAAAY